MWVSKSKSCITTVPTFIPRDFHYRDPESCITTEFSKSDYTPFSICHTVGRRETLNGKDVNRDIVESDYYATDVSKTPDDIQVCVRVWTSSNIAVSLGSPRLTLSRLFEIRYLSSSSRERGVWVPECMSIDWSTWFPFHT